MKSPEEQIIEELLDLCTAYRQKIEHLEFQVTCYKREKEEVQRAEVNRAYRRGMRKGANHV